MFKGFLLGQIFVYIMWFAFNRNTTHDIPHDTITINTPEGVVKISGEGRYYLMDNFIEKE